MKNSMLVLLAICALFMSSEMDDYGTSKYGSNLNVFTLNTQVTNNTTNEQDVINEMTNALDTGLYQIDISHSWNYNQTSSDIITNFYFDDVKPYTRPALMQHEPKDVATNQVYSFFKSMFVKVQTPGTKNVRFTFRTETNGRRARVADLSIKIMRVR